MKRSFSDIFIAFAVIACSAVLLGALTFALSGYRLKPATRTLQVDYEDVTGIKVHSEVRYAGAPAGRVIAMRHLTPEERQAAPNKKNAVRVTVEIQEFVPPLPTDIVASLGSDTMLSQKFVAFSAGTPGKEVLANNALLEGQPAYGLDQIIAAASPVLANANKLLENLNGTVTGVKEELAKLLPKASTLVDTANTAAKDVGKSADALLARATKLIADNEAGIKTDIDELQTLIAGIETAAKNLNVVLGSANKFVSNTDKQLQEQLKELHVALLNLKVITTHAKAITEALGEKPNRLIFSGKANTLTPEAEILKSQKPVPAKVTPRP
jgi:virulence factor Mce-like protein